MAEKLSPFVYWGQNNEKIFLKVDLKDVQSPVVDLDEDGLKFQAEGLGIRGRNEYSFAIEFYLQINADNSKYRVHERCIEFQLQKVGKGEFWPRLMYDQKKPAWLKIDFDHFAFEDESEEEMDEMTNLKAEQDMMAQLERELKAGEDFSGMPNMKTSYLFLYNMFQWVGYTYIFVELMYHYLKDGAAFTTSAFETAGTKMCLVQLVAFLEILHPLAGLVKGNAVLTFMQVGGRNFMLFGIILSESHVQNRGIIFFLFVAWSAIEVIRYPYYILGLFDKDIGIITWARYSLWIPLYPAGFMSEGFTMLLALPYFEQSGRYCVSLPNALNWSFHFPTFLKIYMIVFLIGAYILMRKMYEQRKKKLYTNKKQGRRLGSTQAQKKVK